MGAQYGQIARHDDTSTGRGRSRGYARARGGLDMYKGVSLCVVLWSLWVVGENVLPKKKRQKRGMCVEGAGGCCEQGSVCECARSNVCATVFACCPPTLHSFELVAVAVLADTIFK